MFVDESMEERMARIRVQNAELLKRHKEVEADKNKAAKERALVVIHANNDVEEMTPAERHATLESRARNSEMRRQSHSSREDRYHGYETANSGSAISHRLSLNFSRTSPDENIGVPKLTDRPKIGVSSTVKKNLERMLLELNDDDDEGDGFTNVPTLYCETNDSEPFKLQQGLLYDTEYIVDDPQHYVPSRRKRSLSPELQFHPDMDLSHPPPPFARQPIYGSGRLNKSRLNDATNFTNFLDNGAPRSIDFTEPATNVTAIGDFESDAFSPYSFSSLDQIAQALKDCENQCQPNVCQEPHSMYRNNVQLASQRNESAINDFPEIGNFVDIPVTVPKGQDVFTSYQKPEQKKTLLQLRTEVVRQDTSKRFSRAQFMAKDTSGTVEITFGSKTTVLDQSSQDSI